MVPVKWYRIKSKIMTYTLSCSNFRDGPRGLSAIICDGSTFRRRLHLSRTAQLRTYCNVMAIWNDDFDYRVLSNSKVAFWRSNG